jgi:hypothetical protein
MFLSLEMCSILLKYHLPQLDYLILCDTPLDLKFLHFASHCAEGRLLGCMVAGNFVAWP